MNPKSVVPLIHWTIMLAMSKNNTEILLSFLLQLSIFTASLFCLPLLDIVINFFLWSKNVKNFTINFNMSNIFFIIECISVIHNILERSLTVRSVLGQLAIVLEREAHASRWCASFSLIAICTLRTHNNKFLAWFYTFLFWQIKWVGW